MTIINRFRQFRKDMEPVRICFKLLACLFTLGLLFQLTKEEQRTYCEMMDKDTERRERKQIARAWALVMEG
jgi:hypothetical protein